MTAMDAAELRQLVREVLRDLLPAQPGATVLPAAPPTSDPAPPRPAASGPVASGGGAAAGREGAAGFGVRSDGERAGGAIPVRLATDEDLHEFALRVLRLADNPKRRRDLLAGRLRFTLAPGGSAPANPSAGRPVPTGLPGGNGQRPDHGAAPGHRIDKGAVTERAVQAAANAGVQLVLGPRAVLTPLARDRARALGVPIEKER
ncbi:MAG TPA: hypothetical protein VGJ50_17040 [Streptosporangiaceae bacterium]